MKNKNFGNLKRKRLIATIEDLQKKATQGTTVDQGSSAEMQLGDFLKKYLKKKMIVLLNMLKVLQVVIGFMK